MSYLNLPIKILKKRYKANEKTGVIYRKVGKKWISVGCNRRYPLIKINNIVYKKSRIAFYLFYNYDPQSLFVDHVDGDNTNNAKSNLRTATRSQNAFNSKLPTNNKSGKKGVCFIENSQKWFAFITVNKKRMSLGYYAAKEDAVRARLIAEKVYCGEYTRTGT